MSASPADHAAERVGNTTAIRVHGNDRDPLVVVSGVNKHYGDLHVLNDINTTVGRGEVVVVLGPSGSGKSTLLNLIGGLDTPTSGRIRIGDQDIGSLSRAALSEVRLRKIGFVFQEYNLIPVLSAIENVEYVMLLQGVPEAQRRGRALAILAELGLGGLEHRRPGQLSGGQQQRVAVARAMVSEPMIVLPDEPTANLDSQAGAALLDLMRELNEKMGTTFVFSTHDPMVMQRAKRIIRLCDGKIVP